eukprot:TRINITY_DN23693_c0_g1_i1.p1 TRINITY_DN23693_c0_g1~~TRINITY_DN23693_c0_g1_i1.p1  ORF type:complete len:717 (+),score=164.41 TRINITY_DN23693_c0_g1_i1:26-2152(+)
MKSRTLLLLGILGALVACTVARVPKYDPLAGSDVLEGECVTPDRDRSKTHARGNLSPGYIRPKCTGPTRRYEFGDGTSFNVCEPKESDASFGLMSADGGPAAAGQGTNAFPMTERVHGIAEKRRRCYAGFQAFANMYTKRGPGGTGIGTYLKQIFLYDNIMGLEGMFYYEPGDTIWVGANDLKYPEAYFERVLHHELAHLLEENLVGPEVDTPLARNWRQRWLATLPQGIQYQQKYSTEAVMEFTRGSYHLGFPTPYNRVSMVEDVAQFGSLIMSGHPEVWRCYEASPVCRKKVELVIEMYGIVSPDYNLQHFRAIHRQRGANHLVIEPGQRGRTSGGDFATNVKPLTWMEYVDREAKIPDPPRPIFNGAPPTFSVEPEIVTLGPDRVNVFYETANPRDKDFYGRNAMSRMNQAYSPLAPEHVERARKIVQEWAQGFPYGIAGQLNKVAVADRLVTQGTYGRFFGDPGDTVWLATARVLLSGPGYAYSHKHFVGVLTHEVTHLIANSFYYGKFGKEPEDWRRRWLMANPEGFEYIGAGAPGNSLKWEPPLFKQGFLSGYNRATIHEDIAQYGSALFTGASAVWDCVVISKYCNRKVHLMIEMFSYIDPRYNEQFFLKRAGRDHLPSPLQAEKAVLKASIQYTQSRNGASTNPKTVVSTDLNSIPAEVAVGEEAARDPPPTTRNTQPPTTGKKKQNFRRKKKQKKRSRW